MHKLLLSFFTCLFLLWSSAETLYSETLTIKDNEKLEFYNKVLDRILEKLKKDLLLTPREKEILFGDGISSSDWEFFFSLNYKNRKIQQLKKLVLKNKNFSKNEKETLAFNISPRGKNSAFDWIIQNELSFPPILPEEEWDERFSHERVSKSMQINAIKDLKFSIANFKEFLLSNNGKNLTEVKSRIKNLFEQFLKIASFLPPKNKKDEIEVIEFFQQNIISDFNEVIEILEKNFGENGIPPNELFEGGDIEKILEVDSYLQDALKLQ